MRPWLLASAGVVGALLAGAVYWIGPAATRDAPRTPPPANSPVDPMEPVPSPPPGVEVPVPPEVTQEQPTGARTMPAPTDADPGEAPVGTSIAGTVHGADGRPVAGCRIDAWWPGAGDTCAWAKTEPDGTYALDLDRDGEWRVLFQPGDNVHRSERLDTHVRAGERLAGFDVVLDVGAAIVGRITDSMGAPIAGATATVDRSTGVADSDGRYRIGGLHAGRCGVYASSSRHFKRAAIPVKVPETGEVTVDFVLEAGLAIEGMVVEAVGTPAREIQIKASRQGGGMEATATTDDEGRFFVSPLEPGTYSRELHRRRGGRSRPHSPDASTLAQIRAGTEDVRIVLQPLSTIEGAVRGFGGAPLAKVQIEAFLYEEGWIGTAESDETGSFRIEGLTVGVYELRVSASGHAPIAVEGVIVDGPAPTPVVVRLEAECRVTGRVVARPDDTPIADVYVDVKVSRGGRARTDASGRFAIDSLGSGRFEVSVTDDRFRPWSGEVTLASPGASAEIEISLDRGLGFSGRAPGARMIRLDHAAKSEAASLDARGMLGGVIPAELTSALVEALAAADGRYAFGGLLPGRYLAHAHWDVQSDEDYEYCDPSSLRIVDVSAETSKPVDFVRPDHWIELSGSVRRRGEPVSDIIVGLVGAMPGFACGYRCDLTDDEGRFDFLVPPGRFSVRAPGLAREIVVPADVREHDVDLDLPGVRLSGRVVFGDGTRASASIRAQCPDWPSEWTGSDREGLFAFDGIRPGEWEIVASVSRYGQGALRVRVGERSLEDLVIRIVREVK
jgi:protocatechuate 3,4-dioxygenase beta subunit